jgi:hypothetical protein
MREELAARAAGGHGNDSPARYTPRQAAKPAAYLPAACQIRPNHPPAQFVGDPFHLEFRPAIRRAAAIQGTDG